ncbi:hypothetical protein PHAVU_011G164100 [Phaseolus vulgaris]|uniref:PGG domain-containing protein n=1 Tax=Phaseolus vulgaris TaxID=3885 RepID=V7AJ29_PHAVU|nr:hypothetical protein PHAVU_011G164100g [Phaseolus vulgaris]ESW05240.1 hypothetical protein PHAVU_011G164100g [Phaseolus vulgaris]
MVYHNGQRTSQNERRWLRTNTIELQTILNQRDVEGNTILHIAATKNDTKTMKLLIKVMTDIDAANSSGERAIDIIENQEIKKNLERAEARVKRFRKVLSLMVSMNEWIIRKTGMKEKMSNEIRNAYMIVATLIATTTYQAVWSPPGGFRQINAVGTNNTVIQDHGPSNSSKFYEGKSVMSETKFMPFSTTNAWAFMTAIITIILLMPRNVGWFLLYLPTWLLVMSYSVSIMVISPSDITANLMTSFYLVLLVVLILACLLFFKRSLM